MRLASRPGRVGALGGATLIGAGLACCLLAAGCSSARADRGSTATPATTSGPAEATASPTSPTASAGRGGKIILIIEGKPHPAAGVPPPPPPPWGVPPPHQRGPARRDTPHPRPPH